MTMMMGTLERLTDTVARLDPTISQPSTLCTIHALGGHTMQVTLTDFSNKDVDILSDIIYDALCDKGISFDSFAFKIDVETMEEDND